MHQRAAYRPKRILSCSGLAKAWLFLTFVLFVHSSSVKMHCRVHTGKCCCFCVGLKFPAARLFDFDNASSSSKSIISGFARRGHELNFYRATEAEYAERIAELLAHGLHRVAGGVLIGSGRMLLADMILLGELEYATVMLRWTMNRVTKFTSLTMSDCSNEVLKIFDLVVGWCEATLVSPGLSSDDCFCLRSCMFAAAVLLQRWC